MHGRYALAAVAGFATVLAFLLSKKDSKAIETKTYPGRNNSILVISNGDLGLANALLATSYTLLTEHPSLDIQYGTFKKLTKPIDDINKFATTRGSKSEKIKTHFFNGPDYMLSLAAVGIVPASVGHLPGLRGLEAISKVIPSFLIPWDVPTYLSLYEQSLALIEEFDPAVVVADMFFTPGIDAIRAAGRREVLVVPNALKDTFGPLQPWLSFLWKYPALASEHSYPIPLRGIPANIWLNIRGAIFALTNPSIREKQAALKARGLKNQVMSHSIHRAEQLFISASSLDTDFPLSVLPENVVPCGPIFLSSAPAAQQDSELTEWLSKAPTILINLGSLVDYSKSDASAMIEALRTVFDTTPSQVLWKFNKRGTYSDDFLALVSKEIADDRLRLVKWITAEPSALLETGDIVLSVHHGGANCYNEAVGTGVPQLVLPMWFDCYGFGARVEYLGIGVKGNHKSAPFLDADELKVAFSRVLSDGLEARSIREKAAALGKEKQKAPGRFCAAKEIAKLARLGTT